MNNSSAKTAIKDWPKGERPRDKLISIAAIITEALADIEGHSIYVRFYNKNLGVFKYHEKYNLEKN